MTISAPEVMNILKRFEVIFSRPISSDLFHVWGAQFGNMDLDVVQAACRRLEGKLNRFPYPVDLHKELGTAAPSSNIVGTMAVTLAVDTTQLDAAQAKVEQLKDDLAGICRFEERLKIVDALCGMARAGSTADELAKSARDLSAAVNAIALTPSCPSGASHTAP